MLRVAHAAEGLRQTRDERVVFRQGLCKLVYCFDEHLLEEHAVDRVLAEEHGERVALVLVL